MFCKLQTVWFLRQTLFALFCPTRRGVGGGWPQGACLFDIVWGEVVVVYVYRLYWGLIVGGVC